MLEIKPQALQIITRNHNASGGKCGTNPVSLKIELEVEYSEIQSVIKELINEKSIVIRKGINGELIFKK